MAALDTLIGKGLVDSPFYEVSQFLHDVLDDKKFGSQVTEDVKNEARRLLGIKNVTHSVSGIHSPVKVRKTKRGGGKA